MVLELYSVRTSGTLEGFAVPHDKQLQRTVRGHRARGGTRPLNCGVRRSQEKP